MWPRLALSRKGQEGAQRLRSKGGSEASFEECRTFSGERKVGRGGTAGGGNSKSRGTEAQNSLTC